MVYNARQSGDQALMKHDRLVSELTTRIEAMPASPTQEVWLEWCREYHTPGAYDRIPDPTHGARHVYNHLQSPEGCSG
jgi:hypothetical protein